MHCPVLPPPLWLPLQGMPSTSGSEPTLPGREDVISPGCSGTFSGLIGLVVGAAVWFLLGIAWFQIHGRKGLVLAPEEQFAIAARKE